MHFLNVIPLDIRFSIYYTRCFDVQLPRISLLWKWFEIIGCFVMAMSNVCGMRTFPIGHNNLFQGKIPDPTGTINFSQVYGLFN